MDRSTASDFAYAKACGMYSKSFVGRKIKKLFEVNTVNELCVLVLEEEIPALPEAQLAEFLEKKITENLVRDFKKLLSAYDSPDPLSLALISKYDFINLKTSCHEILRNDVDNSFLIDISPYSIFNWEKWPNLKEIIKNSPVDSYQLPDKNMSIDKIQAWDSTIDRIYYQSVWDGLQALPAKDQTACDKIVRMDIILQNIVWILRLRSYYNLKTDQIAPLLLNIEDRDSNNMVAKQAYFAFDKPLNEWNEWKNWEFSWLLNAHEEGQPWMVDPRWVEFAAQEYIYKLAIKQFKEAAFTVGALVSFFKIKQLEEYMIKFAAENIRVSNNDFFKTEFFGGIYV